MVGETKSSESFDDKVEEALKQQGEKSSGTQENDTLPDPKSNEEPKKEETPKEELKEEPKEQPKEEPREDDGGEEKKDDGGDSAEEPEEAKEFDIGDFNERFKTEFKDAETLESSLKRVSELKQFDTVTKEKQDLETKISELQTKYDEAVKLTDPRQHFANEEEYKRQIILKEHKADINPALLHKIIGVDVNKLSDLDAIVMWKQLSNPNLRGGEVGARNLVVRQLGIDADTSPDDWDDDVRNLISDASVPARKQLQEIKDVDVPEVKNFEEEAEARAQAEKEKRAALTDTWDKISDKVLEDFSTYDLKKDNEEGVEETFFSYEVGNDFKKDAKELMVDFLVDRGMEPNEENVLEARSYIQDLFWRKYGADMLYAYGKDVEAKLTEKNMKDIHNPKDPRKEEDTPPSDSDKAMQELMEYARGEKHVHKPGDNLLD